MTGPVPVFDVQDPRFLPPGDMPARIARLVRRARRRRARSTGPRLVRSIVESLAEAFATSVARGRRRSPAATVDVVHVVGGGAHNALLCQLIADRCGLPVLAGPVEATALGNVLVQARDARRA